MFQALAVKSNAIPRCKCKKGEQKCQNVHDFIDAFLATRITGLLMGALNFFDMPNAKQIDSSTFYSSGLKTILAAKQYTMICVINMLLMISLIIKQHSAWS